jgi:hypothetical protein
MSVIQRPLEDNYLFDPRKKRLVGLEGFEPDPQLKKSVVGPNAFSIQVLPPDAPSHPSKHIL